MWENHVEQAIYHHFIITHTSSKSSGSTAWQLGLLGYLTWKSPGNSGFILYVDSMWWRYYTHLNDVLASLLTLLDHSVNMCSIHPIYGLRVGGCPADIGREAGFTLHIAGPTYRDIQPFTFTVTATLNLEFSIIPNHNLHVFGLWEVARVHGANP